MTLHIPEELSTRIDWSPFAIMGNMVPPRDPDEEDEDEEDEDEDEEVDSAGLGELVILHTVAGQHGCRIALVRPSLRFRRLLETTKLIGLLPPFDDAEAARASVYS